MEVHHDHSGVGILGLTPLALLRANPTEPRTALGHETAERNLLKLAHVCSIPSRPVRPLPWTLLGNG
jgi:hypothetical protein